MEKNSNGASLINSKKMDNDQSIEKIAHRSILALVDVLLIGILYKQHGGERISHYDLLCEYRGLGLLNFMFA